MAIAVKVQKKFWIRPGEVIATKAAIYHFSVFNSLQLLSQRVSQQKGDPTTLIANMAPSTVTTASGTKRKAESDKGEKRSKVKSEDKKARRSTKEDKPEKKAKKPKKVESSDSESEDVDMDGGVPLPVEEDEDTPMGDAEQDGIHPERRAFAAGQGPNGTRYPTLVASGYLT